MLKKPFNCESSSLVYVACCQGCKEEHTGETGCLVKESININRQHPTQPQYEQLAVEGIEKSGTCICDILEITNFTNCCTWLFFNKYTTEHTFPVSWVRKATLRNLVYMNFKTICKSDS